MRIELVSGSETHIAEEIDGVDGVFVADGSGAVYYENEADSVRWFANSSEPLFQRAVEAFNEYTTEVLKHKDEEAQLRVVRNLRESLGAIEPVQEQNNSYWATIISQAEYGHL